jgi:hypothetical protein
MVILNRCVGRVTMIVLIVVCALAGVAVAQFGFDEFRGLYRPLPNTSYDGRFTFVRVRYTPAPGGYWPGRRPSWIHGYPLAEHNLMKIMNEVSFLAAHEEINTVTLDDPELFKYPIAYIIEVGWWTVTDREAAGLRAYLQKGGFLFVDDSSRPAGAASPAAAGSLLPRRCGAYCRTSSFSTWYRVTPSSTHSLKSTTWVTSRRRMSPAIPFSRASSRTTTGANG